MHEIIIPQFSNTQNIHNRSEILMPEIQMSKSGQVGLLITQHVFTGT